MKIRILTNQEVRSFDASSIIIGRDDSCDIQIMKDGISRLHCKIFLNDEKQWEAEDLNSTNGVKLNDKKITRAVLQENDIIELHKEKLQVFELKKTSTETARISVADIIVPDTLSDITIDQEIIPIAVETNNPAPEDNKNQEFDNIVDYISRGKGNIFKADKPIEKTPDTAGRKYKFGNKIFYVTLFCAVIVAASFCFKILDKNKKDETKPVEQDSPPIYLTYVKENITKDNVFRFKLVIEDDQAYFSVDDLKSQLRYGPVNITFEQDDLERLKQTVFGTNFFDLADVPAGISSDGTREYKKLDINIGSKSKCIILKNRPAPGEFMEIEDTINIIAEESNMVTLSLSPEELIEQAEINFDLAEDKFANYETDLTFLREAIHNYDLVIQYLSGVTPEPKIRKTAARKMQKADDIRSKLIKQYQSQYRTMLQNENFSTARDSLTALLSLYDSNSKEYINAKTRLIKLDTLLRRLNKQKR